MSVSSRAYGTAADVAELTGRFTNAGAFDTTTNPTLATVEKWIDKVSATLNVLLAEQGFTVPVTQADAQQTLALFVIESVSDLVNFANSTGRFFSEKAGSAGPWQVIQKEAIDFIGKHSLGLQALGASRTRNLTQGLATTTTDDAGNTIEPMFDRKQFGTANTDWDTEE